MDRREGVEGEQNHRWAWRAGGGMSQPLFFSIIQLSGIAAGAFLAAYLKILTFYP